MNSQKTQQRNNFYYSIKIGSKIFFCICIDICKSYEDNNFKKILEFYQKWKMEK